MLTTASCASNVPTPSADLGEQTKEESSWHCQDSAGTWSCKRLTIGEIQERQTTSQARKVDWPPSESAAETQSGEGESAEATSQSASAPDALLQTRAQTRTKARPEIHSDTPSGPDNKPQTGSTQGSRDQDLPVYQQLMYRPDERMSLEELPNTYWTVQLIALSSARELKDFMTSLKLDGLTGAMIKANDRTYYVALLGVYQTRSAAERAALQRPESVAGYQPYVRSLASLQAAMARANQLPR